MPLHNPKFQIQIGRRVQTFKPVGPLKVVAVGTKRRNPTERDYGTVWSVRMFVGFSVGLAPKYKMADLIALTRKFLRSKTYDDKGHTKVFPEDASFIAQRGVYTYGEAGQVVEEDSAQVIILNTYMEKDYFLSVMQDLAEYLVAALEQESIFVQVQHANVVQDTWRVTP